MTSSTSEPVTCKRIDRWVPIRGQMPKYMTTDASLVIAYETHAELRQLSGEDRAFMATLDYFRTGIDTIKQQNPGVTTGSPFRAAHAAGFMDVKMNPLSNPAVTTTPPAAACLAWHADYDVRVIKGMVLDRLQEEYDKHGHSFWQASPGRLPGMQDVSLQVIPGVHFHCDLTVVRSEARSPWGVVLVVTCTQKALRYTRCLIVNTLAVFAGAGVDAAREVANGTSEVEVGAGVSVLTVDMNNPPASNLDDSGLAILSAYSLERLAMHRVVGAIAHPLNASPEYMLDPLENGLLAIAEERKSHVPPKQEWYGMTDERVKLAADRQHVGSVVAPSNDGPAAPSIDFLDKETAQEQTMEQLKEAMAKNPNLRTELAQVMKDLDAKDKRSDKEFGSALAKGIARAYTATPPVKKRKERAAPSSDADEPLGPVNVESKEAMIEFMQKMYDKQPPGEQKTKMRDALDNAKYMTPSEIKLLMTEDRDAKEKVIAAAVNRRQKQTCEAMVADNTDLGVGGLVPGDVTKTIKHDPAIGEYISINGATMRDGTSQLYQLLVRSGDGEQSYQHMLVPNGMLPKTVAKSLDVELGPMLLTDTVEIQNKLSNNGAWMRRLQTATTSTEIASLAADVGCDESALVSLKEYLDGVVTGKQSAPAQLVGKDGKRPVSVEELRKVVNEIKDEGGAPVLSEGPSGITLSRDGVSLKISTDPSSGDKPIEFTSRCPPPPCIERMMNAATTWPATRSRALEELRATFRLANMTTPTSATSAFHREITGVLYSLVSSWRGWHFQYPRAPNEGGYTESDERVVVAIAPDLRLFKPEHECPFAKITTGETPDETVSMCSRLWPCMFLRGDENSPRMYISYSNSMIVRETHDLTLLKSICMELARQLPRDRDKALSVLSSMDGTKADDIWSRLTQAMRLANWMRTSDKNRATPPVAWLKRAALAMCDKIEHIRFQMSEKPVSDDDDDDDEYYFLHKLSPENLTVVLKSDYWDEMQVAWKLADELTARKAEIVSKLPTGCDTTSNPTQLLDDFLKNACSANAHTIYVVLKMWELTADTHQVSHLMRVHQPVTMLLSADAVPAIAMHAIVVRLSAAMKHWKECPAEGFALACNLSAYFLYDQDSISLAFSDDWCAVVDFFEGGSCAEAKAPHAMLAWWLWTVAGLMSNQLARLGYPDAFEAVPRFMGPAFSRNCAASYLALLAAQFRAHDSFRYLCTSVPSIITQSYGAIYSEAQLHVSKDEFFGGDTPSLNARSGLACLQGSHVFRKVLFECYRKAVGEDVSGVEADMEHFRRTGKTREQATRQKDSKQTEQAQRAERLKANMAMRSKAKGKEKAPPSSRMADELTHKTEQMRSEIAAVKDRLAAVETSGALFSSLDCMTQELRALGAQLDEIKEAYEHKVKGEAWTGLEEYMRFFDRHRKTLLSKKRAAAKAAEDVKTANALLTKQANLMREATAKTQTALEKASLAWRAYVVSDYADADKYREATTRLKTALRESAPVIRDTEEGASLVLRLETALAEREGSEKERKRQARETARTASAPSTALPPGIATNAFAALSDSSPEPSPVNESPPALAAAAAAAAAAAPPELTRAQKEKAKKAARKERKAEQERLARLAQREEEDLAAALHASRIDSAVVQQASDDAAAELATRQVANPTPPPARSRNAVRLTPVQTVNVNGGNAGMVFTNRPPPSPVAQPPTLAALGGSSAPPESTVGAARCIVCMEEDKGSLFLPCKHLICCATCAKTIMASAKKECPKCRAPIKTVIDGIYC